MVRLDEVTRKELLDKMKRETPERYARRMNYISSVKPLPLAKDLFLNTGTLTVPMQIGDYIVTIHISGILKEINDEMVAQRKDLPDRSLTYKALRNTVASNNGFEKIFSDVESKVKEYTTELRKRSNFIKQKREFIAIYRKQVSKSEDKSNFVNLYDICKEMKMGYEKFQIFLTQFYQEERLVRNIFFINIVSTIEQRKRFYIGNAPVIKIKITKDYGI